jgi:hypothetical protein
MMLNFIGVDRAYRSYVQCYPALLQERGISSALIERKGLLSYQDGFGGRKLGLVVDGRRSM